MTEGDEFEDYEKRVQLAADALDEFADQLLNELDITNGGFRWWKGHSDWKRLVLIADYLIASVRGASFALTAASLAADVVRTNAAAESDALREAFAVVPASRNRSIHDFAAAIPRDSLARRRMRTITSSVEHCLFHLGQVLDRLASVIIIVGGFGVENVFRADWKWIIDLANELSGGSEARKPRRKAKSRLIITTERVQPVESAGREVQTKLFAPIIRTTDHGPSEWLEWMRETRNAMTHRPPVRELNMITEDGTVRLLFRHPKWSEVQALAFGQGPKDQPMAGAVLVKSSADIVDGLCDSMNSYVSAIMSEVLECWNARKANPALIVQNASQWQSPRPVEPPSNFSGYGDANQLPDKTNTVVTHPREARRWQAARVFDERRHEWRD
jgi:hypothetical protein